MKPSSMNKSAFQYIYTNNFIIITCIQTNTHNKLHSQNENCILKWLLKKWKIKVYLQSNKKWLRKWLFYFSPLKLSAHNEDWNLVASKQIVSMGSWRRIRYLTLDGFWVNAIRLNHQNQYQNDLTLKLL